MTTINTSDKALGGISIYQQEAVQWLNQALCFYQSSCLDDIEVLRNSPLRQVANRSITSPLPENNRRPHRNLQDYAAN